MIETEFLTTANASLGETWSVRIRGKPLTQQPVLASLIVYLYNEGKGEMAYLLSGGQRSLEEVYGHTPEVRLRRSFISEVKRGMSLVPTVQDVPPEKDSW